MNRTQAVRTLLAMWLLLCGGTACAPVAGNYPQEKGPQKWASNFEGPGCGVPGVAFRVREVSDTLMLRDMIDSLRRKLAGKPGAGEGFKQAEKDQKLIMEMLEDREHVFYRGSLVLEENVTAVIKRGCLLLTVRTEDGLVTVPDAGILFPRHRDRNDYMDSARGPVTINLGYNRLAPGDENRLQVRCRVPGTVVEVAIDADRITVRD